MRWHSFLVVLLISFPVTQALAGAVVMGRGLGRQCYLATLTVPSSENDQRALDACNQAVNANELDSYSRAASLVNRADVKLRMQDFRGALEDADASLSLEPNLGAAYLNRGAGLIGLERYQDALPALEKAITMNDRIQLAYFDRAIVRERQGDLDGAYADYKKALELDPKFEQAKEQLSRFTVVPR